MSESEIIDTYLETKYSPKRKGYFSRGVYFPDVKKIHRNIRRKQCGRCHFGTS
jgi:hypothetical protein